MSGTELEHVDVVDAEIVVDSSGGEVERYDPATLAVLAAMEHAAGEHLKDIRPKKTKDGYARDWALWTEFHAWLTQHNGTPLPLTAVTKGTMVGFVVWLDDVKGAAPSTIDRRITGVTVEARGRGAQVPKEATEAARKVLKAIGQDREKQARGRGQAAPATPGHLQQIVTAARLVPRPAGSRRRRAVYELPELAVLRDRALTLMEFGIAGRAAEVAALDVADITLADGGLEVHVPGVKGRPDRDVEVDYADDPDLCAVRAWQAWKEAAALDQGPAFRPVDQWGHLGTTRMSANAVRLAVTRSAARAGVEVKLTGHSMRSGFITASTKAGKRPDLVRKQSGHAEGSPVFEKYIRKIQRWEETAGKGIL
ncbi:tyrosine-type recombinase/integrase [Streptomyces sp. NPDC053705]|uniref:tyrosine-type recombinase/integrase n=1 Tax=Streptomyces sp. NPDC053705 TaxID=3156668 RepID=UPI0034430E92